MAAQAHITVNNNRRTTMNGKYISKACFGCFYFQCDSTPPPLQVLKGESVSSLERRRDLVTNIMCAHTHTHRGNTQPCFQHLLSKAPGVISLKKTRGWNLILLLALCRLEPSSCHCERHYCHVSNDRPANVRRPLGTSASPPALSGWRAIYLSASASTPSLPNPSFCLGPQAPMENNLRPHHSQVHHEDGGQRDKCLRWMAAITSWQGRTVSGAFALTVRQKEAASSSHRGLN